MARGAKASKYDMSMEPFVLLHTKSHKNVFDGDGAT